MAEVSHAKPVAVSATNNAQQRNMCRKKDHANYGSGKSTFHTRQKKSERNYYKGGQQNNFTEDRTSRPAFMRLDSTGENSAESTEDLSNYDPAKSKRNACGWNFWQPCDTTVGTGLLEKVKSAFIGPHSQNNRTRGRGFVRSNLASSDSDSSRSKLVDLDSVAQKFIPAMPKNSRMMDNSQNRRCTNGWDPIPRCPSPNRTFSQGRAQSQFFHPYHHYQQNYQGNFIQSTMAYRQPVYQPWQRVYGNNTHSRAYPPPLLAGYGYCNRPMMWDHHPFQNSPPPYPGPQEFHRHWQGQVGRGLMMQGPGNFGQTNHQRWTQRPKPHHNTRKSTNSYRHRNRNRTCQQKQMSVESSSSKEAVTEIPEACVDASLLADVPTDLNAAIGGDGTKDTPLEEASPESDVSRGNSVSEPTQSSSTTDKVHSCSPKIHVEHCISIKNDDNAQKPENKKVQEHDASVELQTECTQHSSIAHILADYNARVSMDNGSISTDSDFSDAGCENATDRNSDLWDVFTVTNDPYNPLCGWRCEDSENQCVPQICKRTVFTDADSGTDEGDEWSQSDDDIDCDSDDDEEDVETYQQIDNLQIDNTELTKIQIPSPSSRQYDQGCDNTDNKLSAGGISPIHPSVAFILGSYADSTDDEIDDDNDWDCDDESTSLQSNPLWDSFNKSSDPYSPLEAWKLGGSSLLSPHHQRSSPCSILSESRNRETAVKHEQSVSSHQTNPPADTAFSTPCADRHQSGSSNSLNSGKEETIDTNCDEFSIDEVRVHVSRDDHDSVETPPSSGSMKRVASASCLRKLQLTPELKALKKVRFCPKSSFIVLVDKQQKHEEDESLSTKNDWQACARDRLRFRARIACVEEVLTPILLPSHREQVFQTRFIADKKR